MRSISRYLEWSFESIVRARRSLFRPTSYISCEIGSRVSRSQAAICDELNRTRATVEGRCLQRRWREWPPAPPSRMVGGNQPRHCLSAEIKTEARKCPAKDVEDAGYGALLHGKRSHHGVAMLTNGETPSEFPYKWSPFLDSLIEADLQMFWHPIPLNVPGPFQSQFTTKTEKT